jgi:MFS family permease
MDKTTSPVFRKDILTFLAITLFYCFETAQMSYYNVLAPSYLHSATYQHGAIAALSAAYYYGDMAGLFPIGYALDRLPLRLTMAIAIIGSIAGSFILFMGDSFTTQWIARFICGFFGGTFTFIGGIRIIALTFPKRFTYYMSLFLAAGMLGSMMCQYPLLLIVRNYGPKSAMFVMFAIALLISLFCFKFLHPPAAQPEAHENKPYQGTSWKMFKEIVFNIRNLCDVLMIVLLDTPASVVGTLWGVLLMMNFFHFNASVSSWIVMTMFAGYLVGLPTWGQIADRLDAPSWIIIGSALICLALTFLLMLSQSLYNPWLVALLFLILGFFSSCQTVGFTWVTKNMKPELIGRNSAYNSVIFMGTNGGFKQLGAFLLGLPVLFIGTGSSSNILFIIFVAMGIATIYATVRKYVFNVAY